MDIEIQNRKHEALFKNGKYQYTFIPKLPTEKIKIHHMGCVGDTRLNRIQLEQGNEATFYMAPERKVNSLSGIFKQLRDLDIQMRDQNSELWGKIKLNNTGAILDFYNENIKTQLTTLAGKVNLAISELDNKVLKKTDISITSNGITLGSGKTIDGRTIASIMKVQPDSIDLISPLIRVTGNMVVDGTLEGRKIKANTLETGHHKAGSITTEILAANAVKADKLLVDNAMINKFLANSAFITELFAKNAFINNLKATKFSATQITAGVISADISIKLGEKGIFHPYDNGVRFSIPETTWANNGVGVEIKGNNANGFERGVTIYRVKDLNNPTTPQQDFKENLLTVYGTIKGAFPFISTSVNDPANRMGYAVMSNTSYNTPIRPEGYSGGLWRIVWIGFKDGVSQLWINDGTGGRNSTFSVPMNNAASDINLKENIKPTHHKGLDIIDKFKFKSFDWKVDKYGHRKAHTKIGLIAQEVEDVSKELVTQSPAGLMLEDFRLLNIALKAIQELSEENKKIKKEIEELKYAR